MLPFYCSVWTASVQNLKNRHITKTNDPIAMNTVHPIARQTAFFLFKTKLLSGSGKDFATSEVKNHCTTTNQTVPKTATFNGMKSHLINSMFFMSFDDSALIKPASKITAPDEMKSRDLFISLNRPATSSGFFSSVRKLSMERFSFQRMVKGMQPSRCLAILGETLRPIPASRIYGGAA